MLNLLFVEGEPITRALSVGRLPVLLSIVATAVIGVAAIACIFVERPVIRLGHGWRGRWRKRPPVCEVSAATARSGD